MHFTIKLANPRRTLPKMNKQSKTESKIKFYRRLKNITQAELAKPLPSETRQDFKTFTKIEPNEITEETSNEKKDTKINTKTLSKYDKINTNPITEENKKTA